MARKYAQYEKKFNDEALDALHRSDPDRIFALDEIARALGTSRQTVHAIEKRALRKLKAELTRRGMTA
jgi:DNA-directed RNA polymerase sigma subunit (sigma70/sigma32)